jgi:peptidoglycan/xylan/chitin deacetylase (PgdA/CDA1 family)
MIRLDRVVTLSFAASRRSDTRVSGRIPVLMYHGISHDEDTGRHPYYRTVTSPQIFEKQMAHLHRSGYSTIGVHQIRREVEGPAESAQLVSITFDDGYHDFYVHAFPVLKKYGFTATVFLPSQFIAHQRRQFRGRECMTWNEVRELKESGISFGSHTVTHPQLRELDASDVKSEVSGSKCSIEQELGAPVDSFAYPYAFPEEDTEFKGRLRGILADAGYTCGVCTSVGRVTKQSDPYFMRRLPVNSCDDIRLFDAKLRGAYDWVSHPQKWAKIVKSWLR